MSCFRQNMIEAVQFRFRRKFASDTSHVAHFWLVLVWYNASFFWPMWFITCLATFLTSSWNIRLLLRPKSREGGTGRASLSVSVPTRIPNIVVACAMGAAWRMRMPMCARWVRPAAAEPALLLPRGSHCCCPIRRAT